MNQFEKDYQNFLDGLSADKEDSLLFMTTGAGGFSLGDNISVMFTQNVKVEHRENPLLRL